MDRPKPGDIVLAHSPGVVGGAIRLGQRLRWPQVDAYWNHVAIVVEPYPDRRWRIVEATGHGVVYSTLENVAPDYEIVSPYDFPAVSYQGISRDLIVKTAHELVGDHYGWLTIASIVFNIVTPRWIMLPSFRRGTTWICSAAAAWCLHAGGVRVDVADVYQVLPSEVRAWAHHRVL